MFAELMHNTLRLLISLRSFLYSKLGGVLSVARILPSRISNGAIQMCRRQTGKSCHKLLEFLINILWNVLIIALENSKRCASGKFERHLPNRPYPRNISSQMKNYETNRQVFRTKYNTKLPETPQPHMLKMSSYHLIVIGAVLRYTTRNYFVLSNKISLKESKGL